MSLLQMSLSGAVLTIVIAAIRAAAINKLPKKTFMILWGIVLLRLLIPYSVSSAFSIYSLVSFNMPANGSTINTGNNVLPSPSEAAQSEAEQSKVVQFKTTQSEALSYEITSHEQAGELSHLPKILISPVMIGTFIWLTGMLLCVVFFTISYLHWRFEFQTSLPIQNDYVEQWRKKHCLKRPISVRQSDKISAPLTYGIFKPVILLPKKTDWKNTEQLEYVLLHEYVHICHYDSALKLISTLALCIHWFNPFVWVMYLLFQRDIELACDESVIHRFGETSKSTYAHMLIDMEAKKSGFMPLCNSFSKNAIEERIIAIMKIKKTSIIVMLASVILIIGIATVFATSASAKKAEQAENDVENNSINFSGFSEDEIDKLLALRFDGYEDMSVSEYQRKVWELTDTVEYLALLERFSQDNTLYEKRDSDEVANFLFYILNPLTAEKWKSREFGGYCRTDYADASDNATFEYWITLDILNADALTVGEYNNARIGIMNGLNNILQDKTKEQLQTESVMQKMLHAETEALKTQWSSENLKIDINYVYTPLAEFTTQNSNTHSSDAQNVQEEQEPRRYSNGTEEDYRSLLTLKTPDYQKMSVADFNMALLDWANEDYERMERINIDTGYHDFAVDLTEEELSFVTVSVQFSGMENGAYVRSNYTGKPEVDPSYGQYLPEKAKQENGQNAWCNLYYQFSYHIADKKAITVGERDRCVSGMMSGIQDFWNKTALEDLLGMTKEDIVKELNKIAAEYSDEKITIAISKNQVSFECMDELNIEREEYKTGVISFGKLVYKDEPSNASSDTILLNIDALRVREEALENAAVIGILEENREVTILSEKNGYYHILLPTTGGRRTGWVRKEYVNVD